MADPFRKSNGRGYLLAGAADIGGTKVSVGIVDEQGQILARETVATPLGPGSCAAGARMIADILEKQMNGLGLTVKDLKGIGVGCAGPVDVSSGMILNPFTLPGWEEESFTRRLAQETGRPCFIENDAGAALLGEVLLNHLNRETVLMLTFGTGVGGAVWHEGRLFRATGGYHPELGHVVVNPAGPVCYCGARGCLESVWSGTALNGWANRQGYGDFNGIRDACETGDTAAEALMAEAIALLEIGLWNLMVVFRPQTVILGGGVMARHFTYIQQRMKAQGIENRNFVDSCQLRGAKAETDSALVGASELVYREEYYHE